METTKKIAIYNENCTQAGQRAWRQEENDETDCPDVTWYDETDLSWALDIKKQTPRAANAHMRKVADEICREFDENYNVISDDEETEGGGVINYADVLDQADTGDPAGFMAAAGVDSVSGDVFTILRYDDLCMAETNAGYTQIYYEDSNSREVMFDLPDDYGDIRKIAAAAAIELFECVLSCNDINGIRIPNMCVAVSNEDIDEMIAAAEKFIAENEAGELKRSV